MSVFLVSRQHLPTECGYCTHFIGHQGIHRLLYAYFMGLDRDQAPYVSIPLNTVIELTPNAYGCEEKRYLLLSKEEMSGMSDGQDEPVTSMPMKDKAMAEEVRRKTENNGDGTETKRSHAFTFDGTYYHLLVGIISISTHLYIAVCMYCLNSHEPSILLTLAGLIEIVVM